MMVKLKSQFFSADAGTVLIKIENTREWNVCDECGKRKPCDWFVPVEKMDLTGMDLCSSCAKSLEVKP